jgi:RecB family endonuclease NucS
LREAWKHEAGDFTPWLAEEDNFQALADALDLGELELVATEHPVGDFKLDILCNDEQGPVIIENQLEKTNHNHLGQIIAYVGGSWC